MINNTRQEENKQKTVEKSCLGYKLTRHQSFNLLLYKLMKDKGHTQSSLSRELSKILCREVHRSLINHILHGRMLPSFLLAKAISEFLGCNDSRTLFPDGQIYIPKVQLNEEKKHMEEKKEVKEK